MAIDLSVSLGDVIMASAFAITGIASVLAIRNSVSVVSTKVEETDKRNDERFIRIDAQLDDNKVEMRKLGEVLQTLTRTEGRMNLTDERVLAQGKRIDSMAKLFSELLTGKKPILPADLTF
jgi:hypothetical protein